VVVVVEASCAGGTDCTYRTTSSNDDALSRRRDVSSERDNVVDIKLILELLLA